MWTESKKLQIIEIIRVTLSKIEKYEEESSTPKTTKD